MPTDKMIKVKDKKKKNLVTKGLGKLEGHRENEK